MTKNSARVPQRIAFVTESYLPTFNGVTNTVVRVSEELRAKGHDVLIVAPGPPIGHQRKPSRRVDLPEVTASGVKVSRVPSVTMPGRMHFDVGVATTAKVRSILEGFGPDLLHAAAPFALGASGLRAAKAMRIPSVAIFQTDMAGFAQHYGLKADAGIWTWLHHVHNLADRTLAPSTPVLKELKERGIPRVHRWGRGVDSTLFHPAKRSVTTRFSLANPDQCIVGYMGRLAPEKNVELLASLANNPKLQVVIIGDGPSRKGLERSMPQAKFLGKLGGEDLARVMASLDVFVHTGPNETFCQTIQEAMASGLPVVAPNAGGPVDLVFPGRTGWLFEPGNANALRVCVEQLAGSAADRHSFGRAAYHEVQSRTWSALTDQLLDHYQEVSPAREVQRPVVQFPSRELSL